MSGFLPILYDGPKRIYIHTPPPVPYRGNVSLVFPSSPYGKVPFAHIVPCHYDNGIFTAYMRPPEYETTVTVLVIFEMEEDD